VRASANRGTRLSDVADLGEALRAVAASPERNRLYRVLPDGHYAPAPVTAAEVPSPR
jgi:hypothetical protein